MLKIDKQQLSQLRKDFYNLTGLEFVLYNAEMKTVYSPLRHSEFCDVIRRREALTEKCLECDRRGLEQCARQSVPHVYRCHMGLTEACAPIIENNVVIGYLMVGQALGEDDRDAVGEAVASLEEKYGADKAELERALASMTPISKDKLASAAKILGVCANYLCSGNIVALSRENMPEAIVAFINENLASEELTTQGLCRRFSISRSLLYTMSKQELGMGISEYIRKCRIQAAKRLLRKGDMPICRVAADCGFSTPGYFSKVFFEQVGCLPKDYAKR